MPLERYPSAAHGVVMSAAAYATLPLQQLIFMPLYWAAAAARGALTS